MRIKLNLLQLVPARNPSVYWLYIDDSILFIRQLKEKVQKVLKESRDIELCLDNVPFLDEDDIHAINENEEIAVTVKKKNIFTELNSIRSDNKESNISLNPSNSIYSTEPLNFKSDNDESTISSILPKNSKKRVRKRTHKKKKQETESTIPIEKNGFSDKQPETLFTPPLQTIQSKKLHKRFKLCDEKNDEPDDTSQSSDDDCFQVKREVFVLNSSSLNDNEEKKNNIQPVWRKETPLKTKITNVPIFVRGQTGTKNSIQNSFHTENDKNNSSETNSSEDCDVLVVDWKNMSPMKVSNLLDLQINDLIQFKTLSMNESGEPALSSVITARLEHIYKTTLHIQVLSGIKEFMTMSEKFKMGEEDIGTQLEVEYNDLFEVFKLV